MGVRVGWVWYGRKRIVVEGREGGAVELMK